MKKLLILLLISGAMMQSDILKSFQPKIDKLSHFEKAVMVDKATEKPFTGALLHNHDEGIYHCKLCGAPLFRSDSKFDSGSGWPSFDDEIPGAIKRIPDPDGRRVEIVCAKCGAHLGHVFEGERMTDKNIRHCVNSASLSFEKNNSKTPDKATTKYAKAYFAGGCFWGMEYYMQQIDGVKEVISGFMGGHVKSPDYYDVVGGKTGHLETVEVMYDPTLVGYDVLVKKFFEIHDPEQTNGQGPDIGSQYLSAVFVNNENEANIVSGLIKKLESNGYKVATQILIKKEFYSADEGHQDYYDKKGTLPYCHGFVPRFDRKKR
jgi:peptide methionine sulfoxide reductase msrA/msrB